jgi:hypothetical protein
MFHNIPEQKMRFVQWILVLCWMGLIILMFWNPALARDLSIQRSGDSLSYHPLSGEQCPKYLTSSQNHSPLIDWVGSSAGTCNPSCPTLQGKYVVRQPKAIANKVMWTMVVASTPAFLMVIGHTAWRRICPLSFLSQIPRMLGLQRTRKIKENSWLGQNYWYVQFGLLYLGLCLRLWVLDANPHALALFLVVTIFFAMMVGFFFKGKTWCHYICPFAPVQKILTGTGGLLESCPTDKRQTTKITQSMCRTIDAHKQEQPACVGCKSACTDVNLEKSYWTELTKPGRRFAQYGYLGLVIGFYAYYWLYSGDVKYYFSGAWLDETALSHELLKPGFYILGHVIPIPKLLAVPLTLAIGVIVFYWIGSMLEKLYKLCFLRLGFQIQGEQILHHLYSFYAFCAFNIFYGFAGRSNMMGWPKTMIALFDMTVLVVSILWLAKLVTRMGHPSSSTGRILQFRRNPH